MYFDKARRLGIKADVAIFAHELGAALGHNNERRTLLTASMYQLLCMVTAGEPRAIRHAIGQMENSLQSLMQAILDKLQGSEADPVIDEYHVAVAESRWVTWPGYDKFFDLKTGESVEQLPHPAVWATSIHLGAVINRILQCEQDTDVKQATDFPSARGES